MKAVTLALLLSLTGNGQAAEIDPTVVVDLAEQILTVYRGDHGTTFPCVVGKIRHGSSVTPAGLYQIVGKSASTERLYGRYGYVYGRRYIALRNTENGDNSIGIHGTNQEYLLEKERRNRSKGCIRLGNDVIEEAVYPNVSIGDYVSIVEEQEECDCAECKEDK